MILAFTILALVDDTGIIRFISIGPSNNSSNQMKFVIGLVFLLIFKGLKSFNVMLGYLYYERT